MINFHPAGVIRTLLLSLLVGTAFGPITRAASIGLQLASPERQSLQREARLVVDILQNHHFSGRSFRDMESRAMVSRFLEELDPTAEFLTAPDVEFLHRRFDRTLKSVYVFRGDLQPAFEIFDLFVARAQERLEWVQRRLNGNFDFTVDESFALRAKPVPFAGSKEADRHWELRLKDHMLAEMLRGRSADEAAAEIKRQFNRMGRTIAGYDALAVRERFLDCIIRSFDPHSGYFSSDSTREFAMEMEKAVVGVGLDLRKEEGRCIVTAVQTGGAADLSGGLSPGDFIEAVAEGDGEWVELGPLRLREIVSLLRGPAGTAVRLAFRAPDVADRQTLTLERSRVGVINDRARGAVSDVPAPGGARRIGWISLPSFYAAGEESALSSVTRDVRELLEDMTRSPLDGLVIDLRNNPGGAVTEASALSELFLTGGIMMLSRGLDGKIVEHRLQEGQPAYRGPLIVLVSAASASASEVFAGAMRHHRRALIMGAGATFGKGTVQNYIELARTPAGASDWGMLRLTREQFYLPDGRPVQGAGVEADLVLPALDTGEPVRREADLPGALSSDKIEPPSSPDERPLPGVSLDAPLIAKLRAIFDSNVGALPEWALMREAADMSRQQNGSLEHSLLEERRRTAWLAQEALVNDWQRRQRSLAAESVFPTVPFETKEVRTTLHSLDARLRVATAGPDGLLHRLHQGAFVLETETGRWRKLRLESFEFSQYVSDAGSLAAALSAAGGPVMTEAAIRKFLERSSLLEYPTERELLELASDLVDPEASPAVRRSNLEALLREITILDNSLRRDRPVLDVPLREALRIAAHWASLLPFSPRL